MLGIVTVDDVIDTMIADTTEAAQKFGGMEALGQPYMKIGFAGMIRKRAGWLAALLRRNADGKRHAAFRGRAGEGSR